jgi:hypothetical protein
VSDTHLGNEVLALPGWGTPRLEHRIRRGPRR